MARALLLRQYHEYQIVTFSPVLDHPFRIMLQSMKERRRLDVFLSRVWQCGVTFPSSRKFLLRGLGRTKSNTALKLR